MDENGTKKGTGCWDRPGSSAGQGQHKSVINILLMKIRDVIAIWWYPLNPDNIYIYIQTHLSAVSLCSGVYSGMKPFHPSSG